jgi:hypothetical protein
MRLFFPHLTSSSVVRQRLSEKRKTRLALNASGPELSSDLPEPGRIDDGDGGGVGLIASRTSPTELSPPLKRDFSSDEQQQQQQQQSWNSSTSQNVGFSPSSVGSEYEAMSGMDAYSSEYTPSKLAKRGSKAYR